MIDNIKDYFDNTSQEQLEKDAEELAPLNETGQDVEDYIEYWHFYRKQDKKRISR